MLDNLNSFHLSNEKFYEVLNEKKLQCNLCPITCKIGDGQFGKCKIRQNINGKLYLNNYGKVVQATVDYLENRPIFLLGNKIKTLSIGLTGCNNTCPFCQNWLVSQNSSYAQSKFLNPEDILNYSLKNNVEYVSFTFTEPIVWIEYLNDVAKLLKKNNIKICLKTAGYISEKFFSTLIENVDAINLDIKPLQSDYLIKCGIYDQEIIWKFAKFSHENNKHIEISHIIIPTINDNEDKINLFSEKLSEINKDIGIHLLKHYPAWKSNYPATKDESLLFYKNFLKDKGHSNVFYTEVG